MKQVIVDEFIGHYKDYVGLFGQTLTPFKICNNGLFVIRLAAAVRNNRANFK